MHLGCGRSYWSLVQSRGMGVVNASALSMGLLTQRGPAPWHPAGAEVRSAWAPSSVDECLNLGEDSPASEQFSSLRAYGWSFAPALLPKSLETCRNSADTRHGHTA